MNMDNADNKTNNGNFLKAMEQMFDVNKDAKLKGIKDGIKEIKEIIEKEEEEESDK